MWGGSSKELTPTFLCPTYGVIGNQRDGTWTMEGGVSAILIGRLAIINFQGYVTAINNATSGNSTNYGLNSVLISNLLGLNKRIIPIIGGIILYRHNNDMPDFINDVGSGINGIGGTFSVNNDDTYWVPARAYYYPTLLQKGCLGVWGCGNTTDTVWQVGSMINGICYGLLEE